MALRESGSLCPVVIRGSGLLRVMIWCVSSSLSTPLANSGNDFVSEQNILWPEVYCMLDTLRDDGTSACPDVRNTVLQLSDVQS